MTIRCALLPLLIAMVPSASAAQTSRTCVTPIEAQNIVMFALPDVMTNTIERCRPHVAANAYLLKSGSSLAASYRVAADSAWPKAKPAMLRALNQPMMSRMPDSMSKPFFGGAIGALASDRVQPTDCDTINRAVEALAPLPPQNMAALIGLVIEKQGPKATATTKKAPIEICPPPSSTVATK